VDTRGACSVPSRARRNSVPFPSASESWRTPLGERPGERAFVSRACCPSVTLTRVPPSPAGAEEDFVALARIAVALWCATNRRCATFSDCCLCSMSVRSSASAVPPLEVFNARSSAGVVGVDPT
jgi:hypothetical protein